MQTRTGSLLLACSLSACTLQPLEADPDTPPEQPERAAPAQARMHRLTASEYRLSVQALLGVKTTAPLPEDYRLHGFTSVGASELSIPSAAMDRYEAAAWEAATITIPNIGAADALIECDLATTPEPERCVGPWAAELAHRAWRRPIDADDVQDLVGVYTVATDISHDPAVGAQAVVATVLQSPWFLFRVEVGHATSDPARRKLTDHELASRLASFLLGGPPDAELLAAADDGALTDDKVLLAQVDRLLALPDVEATLARFFRELLDLDRLRTVDKDPDLYPHFTPALREAMIDEVNALFVNVALTRDKDVRRVFTEPDAWVTPALAAHYGLGQVAEAGWALPPTSHERGGVLGRAGFLALQSHPAATSPTHRGLFVQTRLLCNTVAPPPEGVDTVLPDIDPDNPRTTRQRLEQHANDPACSGCHNVMDPVGLALERFDATGAFRTHEQRLRIDATAVVGGQPIDGAAELGVAIADHHKLPACFTRQLYRHALGQHESAAESDALDDLTTAFAERDFRLKALVRDLVMHDAFRHVAPPETEACADEGATQPCETSCGEGERTCLDGRWRDCSAARALPETCNGEDDDCDGIIDEAVRTCDGALGRGLQTCAEGEWLDACEGRAPRAETCNGVDDDGDGSVDEELQVEVVKVDFGTLVDSHPSCAIALDGASGACRAATHRTCRDSPCSATGFGPIHLDEGAGTAHLGCLDKTEGVVKSTTYTALSAHHAGCNAGERWGPACNAAIGRWCGSQGLTTGFGPLENSGDTAYVTCTPEATTMGITYPDLAPFSAKTGPACDGAEARYGPACNTAIHEYCRNLGHRTGHGPLENYYDNVSIACLGVIEEGQ